jgi:hypothetical protein
LFAALILSACGSPTDPVPEGSYELVAIDGTSLPAPVLHDAGPWQATVLSGEFTISGARYATKFLIRRGAADSTYTAEEFSEGSVRRQRGVITLVGDEGVSLDELIVVEKGLEVRAGLTSTVFTYRLR